MKKLETMLEDEASLLHRCAYCDTLFTLVQQPTLQCSKAQTTVDFHGNVVARHVVARNWSLSRFINYLHTTARLPWRSIYWRLWGYRMAGYCKVCGTCYRLAESLHCYYHPSKPSFSLGTNKGAYPCCNAVAYRFPEFTPSRGCVGRAHVASSLAIEVPSPGHDICRSRTPSE